MYDSFKFVHLCIMTLMDKERVETGISKFTAFIVLKKNNVHTIIIILPKYMKTFCVL